MNTIELLKINLERNPKEEDIAGHFADRISAMEQLQRIARNDGDTELLTDASQKIYGLRKEARSLGLIDEKYPGLYR